MHFTVRLSALFLALLTLANAANLDQLAQLAAGSSDKSARARARSAFFAALPQSGPQLEPQLHYGWLGYLLATDDAERSAVLNFAASIPSAHVRMLIGSFRDFPTMRKAFSAADKAHTQLVAPSAAQKPSGKRVSPREIFGHNSFDAPFICDLWEDPEQFSGRWSAGDTVLDVIAYPAGNYRGRLRRGKHPAVELVGFVGKDSLLLLGPGIRATLAGPRLELREGKAKPLTLQRTPVGVTSFASRPEGARVLLDATTGLRHFRQKNGDDAKWIVHPDGSIEIDPGQGSIFSRDAFGDARIYLEFRHAFNREGLGPRRGNSGLYVGNAYEVQIVDSFGEDPTEVSEGSIYHVATPLVQASAPPLEWQSLEIEFRAPRFNAQGEKIAHARMSVWHNGVKIHDDVEVPHPTAASPATARTLRDPLPPQPLMLQNHGNRVQFRNLWVLPRDAAAQ